MAYMRGTSFLERIGVIPAYRNPEPRFAPGNLLAHVYPVHSPKPNYKWQGYLQGEPVPDRGPTLPWPNPE